ncbi:MAG: hydrogenase expression/formation protein HypE [Phycisphaerae bacterium]|nr:hydrogenase expression/formation protein HypE [Phycisphaerae bacterium]
MDEERDKRILLAHGGGGRLMGSLIATKILPRFANATLGQLADAAAVKVGDTSVLFTTDSFVVKPLFFHGGDIGKLAVCGTVNDLAVAGARPVALSLALIIEEGFEMALLEKILDSAAEAAREAGVEIVAGDTKVVERGAADGIFINTAGIGTRIADLSMKHIEAGDAIIINGAIGDHGMAIMSQRKGIEFDSPIQSDCAALSPLTCAILEGTDGVRFMRDATRGGVAAVLNEIAAGARHDIELVETQLPVNAAVQAAADMLGFDVLDIANEGKVIIVVSQASAAAVLETCRAHALGRQAAVIGRVLEAADDEAIVEMATVIGGRRVVQMPYGRELPRIC